MVVLEAWANGKPVVMTPQCNLPEGFQSEAAIRVETEVESVAAGLRTLCSMTDLERASMGERGEALVRRRFVWPVIARELGEVYDWMLGGGPAPACVRK
jgi:poly(glycerol-phosphate) alpha-glucosyltransferase